MTTFLAILVTILASYKAYKWAKSNPQNEFWWE